MTTKNSKSSGSLREHVYQELKREILNGIYKPGEQLSVNDIAIQHKTSVTPVRDALNALEQEGLIKVFPRLGYFVSSMTIKEFRDKLELRAIIEGTSAEIAAKNITEEEIKHLESLQDDFIPGDNASYLSYLEANLEFHCSIARATRNKEIVETVSRLLHQTQRVIFWAIGSTIPMANIVNAHRDLVNALKLHNSADAKRIMVEGIEDTVQTALASLLREGSTTIPFPILQVGLSDFEKQITPE